MRRKIVAGNWKMNGDIAFAKSFVQELGKQLGSGDLSCDVIIAPPSILLGTLLRDITEHLAGVDVTLAAQNVSSASSGAYTGEISVSMIEEFSCKSSIVGHSERRSLYSESSAEVAAKVGQLVDAGIAPILCVGESLEERESGAAEQVVAEQLDAVLTRYSAEQLQDLIVAYEPVWAIGTGKTASPEQAQEMHAFIRGLLARKSGDLAQKVRILYGGSVNAANAEALFGKADIDGGLVGGASLKASEFAQICKSTG
jgi:triosephosphate isomerase